MCSSSGSSTASAAPSHLVNTVLTGQGAQIDTTAAAGRLVFGTFSALAEFERELIRERTLAWLTAALYIGSGAWTVKMEIPA